MTHNKQLFLVTFCYTTAGIGASFHTDGGGWRTDRHGTGHIYLDFFAVHEITLTSKVKFMNI